MYLVEQNKVTAGTDQPIISEQKEIEDDPAVLAQDKIIRGFQSVIGHTRHEFAVNVFSNIPFCLFNEDFGSLVTNRLHTDYVRSSFHLSALSYCPVLRFRFRTIYLFDVTINMQ